MKTVFWIIASTLVLSRGEDHDPIRLHLIELESLGQPGDALGDLRFFDDSSETITNIVTSINWAAPSIVVQDTVHDVEIGIVRPDGTDINKLTDTKIICLQIVDKPYVNRGASGVISRDVVLHIAMHTVTSVLYFGSGGDIEPGKPMINIVHMKGAGRHYLTVHPCYGTDSHGVINYSHLGGIGHFVHVRNNKAEYILGRIKDKYGDNVTIQSGEGESRYTVSLGTYNIRRVPKYMW